MSPEASILKTVELFSDGWNEHDAKRIASAFADDADYVTVAGGWWRGRGEIAEQLAPLHRGRFRDAQLKARNVSIRFIRPDVALVHLAWEMTGDREKPRRRGLFTLLASRQGGRWRFDAAQTCDLIVD